MAAVKSAPTSERPEAVREWAKETGREVAAAGRLPRALIDAYNEAHPEAPFSESTPPTVSVEFVGGNHRTVTRQVVLAEARKALRAAGLVGERGPIKHDALVLFASGKVPVPTDS